MTSRIDDLQYHVFDIGSLPSECEKGIHGFARASGFHCLIYTVPLSGYDQSPVFSKFAVCCTALQRKVLLTLVQNQILESLYQFASDCLHTSFKGATIILLFTHLDLFEAKMRKKLFRDHFPDYTGRQDDSIAAGRFIAQKFRDVCNGMTIAEIFFINATDTKESSVVLSRIEDLMKRRWQEENLQIAESDIK